jgi:hypothetical protein
VSRAVARQISFADFELMRQGMRLEPLLQAIGDFLDDQKEMIERVRRDLVRGLKKPGSGRRGFRSAAARKRRNARHTKRVRTSRQASAFGLASRGASRSCSEVAA